MSAFDLKNQKRVLFSLSGEQAQLELIQDIESLLNKHELEAATEITITDENDWQDIQSVNQANLKKQPFKNELYEYLKEIKLAVTESIGGKISIL